MGVRNHSFNTPPPSRHLQLQPNLDPLVSLGSKPTVERPRLWAKDTADRLAHSGFLPNRGMKSRVEANSPHGRTECPRIYIPSHRSSLTQEHSQTCMRTKHALCSVQRPCFLAEHQSGGFVLLHLRIIAEPRIARGGVRLGLFLFPFLALRGCFEGWCFCFCCFTRKSPAQPALVAVTKNGVRPTRNTGN